MFKNKVKFTGYQMLKDILAQEKELGLYQGRAAVVQRHERYINIQEDVEIDLDTEDNDEVPF